MKRIVMGIGGRTARAERTGSVLVLAAAVLGSLAVLSLVYLQLSSRAVDEQQAVADDARAALLAEAALREALFSIEAGSTGAIGSIDEPVRYGGGLFWVDAEDQEDDTVLLRVIALDGSGRAGIEAVAGRVPRTEGIDFGLSTLMPLDLEKKVVVDSYDSALGTYDEHEKHELPDGSEYARRNGNVRSNGGVRVAKEAHVLGEAQVGPGGVVEVDNKGSVEATSDEDEVYSFPALRLPPMPPSSGELDLKGAGGGFDLVLGPGEHRFDALKMDKDARVSVTGPATIVIDGKVEIDGELAVDGSNGPVTIYVADRMKLKDHGSITTSTGGADELFLLVGNPEDGKKTKKVAKLKTRLEIEGALTGVVFAPGAHVKLKKEAQVFGSVLAFSAEVQDSARIHYDEGLGSVQNGRVGRSGVARLSSRPIDVGQALRSGRSDPFALLEQDKQRLPRPADVWEPVEESNTAAEVPFGSYPWLDESFVME